MNKTLVRAGVVAVLLASVLLGSAAPTLASCVMPPSIEESIRKADVVFVGRVLRVSNMDRWATIAVEEVWIGPDLPPLVEVRGGSDPGSASSVDRAFTAGTSYLFVPYIEGGVFHDNSCSATMPWAADLVRLRPATARPPLGGGPEEPAAAFDPATLLVPAAAIVGAGVLVFGGVFALRRRR